MSRRHVLWVMIVLAMSSVLPLAARAAEPASLSGRITDAAGAPVAEAEVSVAELKLRTTSGTDGSFTFAGLPAGRYTISVRRQGFAPAVVPVMVPQTGARAPLTVSLTTTPFEIAPLDVTATRGPNDPARSPQATASLSGDAVQKERSVSLAHAIDALPGMRTISTGEQVGKPVIRGLSGPRVLVLEDGYRLEDYSWSDEDGPSVDARLTDRVEVIRGPASVLYGSDAMGGVVNAVPADLPDARERASFTKGGVELYGASNNAEFGTALRLEHASGNFGSRIFAVGRHGADIHTPDGEIPNTG
ncbi:MAG TPA: TonB-dependent receptor plug domain-containing protein, partial [Candidatus Eisenbacteria bacterium]|nr:TonB-dependent receptor plug domain-containing protein [Candidatus Eisenbacteria bacterium]